MKRKDVSVTLKFTSLAEAMPFLACKAAVKAAAKATPKGILKIAIGKKLMYTIDLQTIRDLELLGNEYPESFGKR